MTYQRKSALFESAPAYFFYLTLQLPYSHSLKMDQVSFLWIFSFSPLEFPLKAILSNKAKPLEKIVKLQSYSLKCFVYV